MLGCPAGNEKWAMGEKAAIPLTTTTNLPNPTMFHHLPPQPASRLSQGADEEDNFKGGRKWAVVGHRGCGVNVMKSVADPRLRAFKENSLRSFNKASSLFNINVPHLPPFVEFDVQVTKDDCPVIFHDDLILTQAQGSVVEKRVTDLTLDEFLSYGPQKQPGKEGKPLFKKTKDGRVVEWAVENDDALCTLEEAFENVNKTVGFDIEFKFDDFIVYKEEELSHVLEVILNVIHKHAKQRPIFLSSFHPDAARLMGQMQSTYPVFLITKGGTEIYKDPRRNSLEEALKHCEAAGLQGIVSEAKAIFKNPGMVPKIKECKLALLTYGQLNNVAEAVYLQHLMGVDGVVVDFVQEIAEALSGFLPKSTATEAEENTATDGKTRIEAQEMPKPKFSEIEMSFLLKLIPELMQT